MWPANNLATIDLRMTTRAVVTVLYYEIRVAGVLPPEALLDFERLSAVQPVETVLQGTLPDQAALHGLLARLETFGAQIIEIRRFRPVVPLPAEGTPATGS